MRPLAVLVLFLILPAIAARAGEKFDPAARAKTIAPYVDEETFAILRVDVARLNIAPLFDLIAQWAPEEKSQVQVAKIGFDVARSAFLAAGGKEIYMVISAADLSLSGAQRPPLLIVTLGEKPEEKSLFALMKPAGYEVAERMGSVLFVGSPTARQRLKSMKPDVRPELAPAFEAAGDTAVQGVFIPPAYYRRVIEEMSPALPTILGGGPSTVLTRGVRWAAAGADASPHLSFRAVIQSQDHESAAALLAAWSNLARRLGAEEEIRRALPKFDEFVRLLTPAAQGDRLILVLDNTKGMPALLDLLKSSLEEHRAKAPPPARSDPAR